MLKKVFNWSEVHLSEVTFYKIHTLVISYYNQLTNVTGGLQCQDLKNIKTAKKYVYHCTYNGLASWLGTTNF